MPSLERSAYKLGPWLVSENLDFRGIPTIPKLIKVPTISKLCTDNAVYVEQLLFFWESGIFAHARQKVST